MISSPQIKAIVFSSDLGYIATAWRGRRLYRVTFGHAGPQAAIKAIQTEDLQVVQTDRPMQRLVVRLQAYASGQHQDHFRDVVLDMEELTEFQQAVIRHCRQIRCGKTVSYGELARSAGFPRAARAVGSVMANNRWPLIIPCHRVVAANGLGGFSARQGLQMKKRLLSAEACRAAAH